MQNPITITVNDYEKLWGLAESYRPAQRKSVTAKTLFENLEKAKLLSQTEISSDIVTMNSCIRLRELNNSREAEITLSYPDQADPHARRVSVLSDVGIALLGRRENDIVSWRTPKGLGLFEVKKVVYQPEAAGDYNL